MIAIIDSGSTKADWIVAAGGHRITFSTTGMNPTLISESVIEELLKKEALFHLHPDEVTEVYYYGTGCSGGDQKRIVSNAFQRIFTRAHILVESDIMGAVIATCGNKPGIACIIGTGSNSVFFDGEKIVPNNYGLGYVLADEAAGTYLGKEIITNYLYDLLPKKLSDDFKEKYHLTRESVIHQIYNNPTANTWLASFSEFYAKHAYDPWIRETIKKGFEKFTDLFVLNYKDYQKVPVHFVGSIAFHYKEILEEVVVEKKLLPGKIIKKPIDGLIDYYLKQQKK